MDDAEFNAFREQLAECVPAIPDVVLEHFMERCGVTSCDPQVQKTIALMAHKFLADVAAGAMQYHRIHTKAAQKDKRFAREKKPTLQVADLERALADMGIDVTRPHYFL